MHGFTIMPRSDRVPSTRDLRDHSADSLLLYGETMKDYAFTSFIVTVTLDI